MTTSTTLGSAGQPVQLTLENILAIINLAQTALPSILALITLIKNSDPSATIGDLQAQAQAIIDSNTELFGGWMDTHPEVKP